MTTTPTLAALRAAARALIDVPGDAPVRWRVVQIEYQGGVAPVCTASSYTLPSNGYSWPTHQLDPEVFGPDARDDTGLYDCCPSPHIELFSDDIAAWFVALLNADADQAENREQLLSALAKAEADAAAAGRAAAEIQWTGDNITDVVAFMHPQAPVHVNSLGHIEFTNADDLIGLWTPEAFKIANKGDSIIRCEDGTLSVRKAEEASGG